MNLRKRLKLPDFNNPLHRFKEWLDERLDEFQRVSLAVNESWVAQKRREIAAIEDVVERAGKLSALQATERRLPGELKGSYSRIRGEPSQDTMDYCRWLEVSNARREGLTWTKAYDAASERSEGRLYAGSWRTMKDAYQRTQRLRVRGVQPAFRPKKLRPDLQAEWERLDRAITERQREIAHMDEQERVLNLIALAQIQQMFAEELAEKPAGDSTPEDVKAYCRWHAVLKAHEKGLSWDKAYDAASAASKKYPWAGKPSTMKRGYQRIQRLLREAAKWASETTPDVDPGQRMVPS